jgi:hypothetical protein
MVLDCYHSPTFIGKVQKKGLLHEEDIHLYVHTGVTYYEYWTDAMNAFWALEL